MTDTDTRPGTDTGAQFGTFTEPTKETKETTCTHPTDQKCADCVGEPNFWANSFAELDDLREASSERRAVEDVLADFRQIAETIMWNFEMDADQKAAALSAATVELAKRVKNPPERKSFLEKARDLVRGDKDDGPPEAPPKPQPEGGGAFKVFKDQAGNYRWLSVYSNNLWDRDGEVIPASEHAKFIKQVDESGKYPELWTWHTPGTRSGVADLLDLTTEGFAMAGGLFDTGKEAVAKSLAEMESLGVSHGFSYESKTAAGEILGYKTFEISPLPRARAANTYTGILIGDTDEENLMSLTPEKKAFLTEVHGAEFVSGLEAQLSKAKVTAEGKGIDFKDLLADLSGETAPAPAAAPAPTAPAPKDEPVVVATSVSVDGQELVKALSPVTDAIATLVERLEVVEAGQAEAKETAKAEEKSIADLVGEAMKPKNGVYVASLAKDTTIHGNDADAKAVKAGGDGAIPEHQRPQMDLLATAVRATPEQIAQVVNPDVDPADNSDGGAA